jgi:hypothetical protein
MGGGKEGCDNVVDNWPYFRSSKEEQTTLSPLASLLTEKQAKLEIIVKKLHFLTLWNV